MKQARRHSLTRVFHAIDLRERRKQLLAKENECRIT